MFVFFHRQTSQTSLPECRPKIGASTYQKEQHLGWHCKFCAMLLYYLAQSQQCSLLEGAKFSCNSWCCMHLQHKKTHCRRWAKRKEYTRVLMHFALLKLSSILLSLIQFSKPCWTKDICTIGCGTSLDSCGEISESTGDWNLPWHSDCRSGYPGCSTLQSWAGSDRYPSMSPATSSCRRWQTPPKACPCAEWR